MKRIHKSDAQANAEALARRSATYADEHAQTWEMRFDRREPLSLRDLVRDISKGYADEVPTRIHVHAVDGGGDPDWSPEFKAYLFSSDFSTDRHDAGVTEVYITPFRACMSGMERSSDEATRKRAAIVSHVVVGGLGPAEAAILEGVPTWCAKDVAVRALGTFWRRWSAVRLDLAKSETAA